MNKEYFIIIYSKWVFLAIWIICFSSIVPVLLFTLHFNLYYEIIMILYMLFLLIPMFLLPKKIAKGHLHISIDKDIVNVEWVKSYWGVKKNKRISFDLNNLTSFKHEPSYNFSSFKLTFNNNKMLTFHRWKNDSNDEFDEFYSQFKKNVSRLNKKHTDSIIIQKPLIMENKKFIFAIAVILAVILAITIFLIFHKSVENPKAILILIGLSGPLIWLCSTIVKRLLRKRTRKD